MTNTERDEMQHLIDCAYDCDEPALAEERKALLIAMGPRDPEPESGIDIYAGFRREDGTIDTGLIFGEDA